MLLGYEVGLLTRVFLAILLSSAAGGPGLAPVPLLSREASLRVSGAAVNTAADDAGNPAAGRGVSDVTLFLLGGGLALLVALLAWGEQIRKIAKDTRDLERNFMQSRGLTRAEFLPILKPKTPTDQLVALTQLMNSGKLKTAPEVEVLACFQQWSALAGRLARLFSLKYWLTIALTVALFIGGGISGLLDLCPAAPGGGTFRTVFALIATALIVALLTALIAGAHAESRLNELLVEIGERV